MSCKGHYVIFAHAIGKPHTYGCSPDIMESSCFDASFSENFVKTPLEIIYHLEPGVRESQFVFRPEYILDVIIPRYGNENIGIPFRLLCLVIYKHLNDFLCQWEDSAISIFDKPLPCVLGVFLGVNFNGLSIKVNVCPSAI